MAYRCWIAIKEKFYTTLDWDLRTHFTGRIGQVIESLSGVLQVPQAYLPNPEWEKVQEAFVAAKAQITIEQEFIQRYTRSYPLGIVRIGMDKMRNVDTPFTAAGKQRRTACSRQLCIAMKDYIAAAALESENGFDDGVAAQIIWYENWLKDIEAKERRYRTTDAPTTRKKKKDYSAREI